MVNILFSARSNIIWDKSNPLAIDAFYESFIHKLKDCGNNVVFLRMNNEENVNYKLENNFKPDLIITANNEIPLSVLKDTSCPVILWNSDSPAYYLHPEYIRENVDRYLFANAGWGKSFVDVCCSLYGCKKSQHFSIGYATDVRAEEKPIKQNIVFMGTIGWCYGAVQTCLHAKTQQELDEVYEQCQTSTSQVDKFDAKFLHVLTSNQRIKILDALCDLGLTCYGWIENYATILPYSLELLKTFKMRPVYSLKDIQDEFNSSLIAPTLPNAQAIAGCSWRVADVMASNACLISPPKPDLLKISPYVKIPTYESPAEARALCQKLLKDETWRKDIVLACQKAIDEKCRFSHLFKKLEEMTGFSILNLENSKHHGTLIVTSPLQMPTSKQQVMENKPQPQKVFEVKIIPVAIKAKKGIWQKFRKSYKLMFYAFLLFCSAIFPFNCVLKKKKIVQKINKYIEL